MIPTFFIIASLAVMSQSYILTMNMNSGLEPMQIDTDHISNISFKVIEVKQIDDYATEVPKNYFKNNLAPMPLPGSLKLICESAFESCRNEVVVIPEGVEKIEDLAFYKGYMYLNSIGGDKYYYNVGCNLKWIYVPESVKSVGGSCFSGIKIDGSYDLKTIECPYVVFESTEPPSNIKNALHTGSKDGTPGQIIYVPKGGVISYIFALPGSIYLDKKTNKSGAEIKISVYSPVSVDITEEKEQDGFRYYWRKTSENKGEITGVRWALSDPSVAKIDCNGVLKALKVGKTYVQCIVSTPASDGKEIEFYFFKPVEVTADMLND